MVEKVLPPSHSVRVKNPAPNVRRGARVALSSQDALCTRGDIVQSNCGHLAVPQYRQGQDPGEPIPPLRSQLRNRLANGGLACSRGRGKEHDPRSPLALVHASAHLREVSAERVPDQDFPIPVGREEGRVG